MYIACPTKGVRSKLISDKAVSNVLLFEMLVSPATYV